MSLKAKFLVLVLLMGLGPLAKADYFQFAVSAVAPNSAYTQLVQVDIAGFTSICPYGFRALYLNIDGANYPVTSWNAMVTSPYSLRAWFTVPANFWGMHRLQLTGYAWVRPYYGYPVPVVTFYSFPQLYRF